MARYTSLYTVAVSLDRFRQLLTDILRSCSLDVIYSSEDYLLARELPGQVSFAKLVTVEVLIDQPHSQDSEVRMNFVVKNEELPLKSNNHCREIFNMVNQAISENRQWHLIESAAS
jgi:C4-type Zn-finger protein